MIPPTALSHITNSIVNSGLPLTIEDKRGFNLRARISQFPDELFSEIFLDVQHAYLLVLERDEGFFTPFEDVGSELWIGITHVCHRWRQIALGIPKLWTRVVSSPDNNKWTQEMLIRSKNKFLTTIILGRVDSETRPIELKKEQLDQIRTLSRTLSMRNLTCEDLHKFWPPKWAAQNLDHLVIQCDDEHPSFSTSPFTLSDSNLVATSLRRLEIRKCRFDWKSGFLNHLTHLGLGRLPADMQLGFWDFIKALSRMPLLQELRLDYGHVRDASNSGSPPSPEGIIVTPPWQFLDITDKLLNIALFLNHIALQPLARLHLTTSDNLLAREITFYFILRRVQNHFNQTAGPSESNQIRSFKFCELPGYFSLQGYNEILSEDDGLHTHTGLFVLTFMSFDNDDMPSFSINSGDILFQILPLNHIVVLELSMPNFCLTRSAWTTTLGSIPTLETIRVNVGEPMSFFMALLPSANGSVVPFRALKSLGLLAPLTLEDNYYLLRIMKTRHDECRMPLREFVFFNVDDDSLPPPDLIYNLSLFIPYVGVRFSKHYLEKCLLS